MFGLRFVALAISGIALTAAPVAFAAVLATPPLPIDNTNAERAACSVMNGGSKAIGPFTITIVRLAGTEVASEEVPSLGPGVSEILLVDANQISTASTVSCIVEGKGISKKTPISLCTLPSATYTCSASVQAP